MNIEYIEQGLFRTAKQKLASVKSIIQGERNDLIKRLSEGRGLSTGHVIYDLVTTELDFTDQLLNLFDYEDNGFSVEFRAEIRQVNEEAYRLASGVFSTLGKSNSDEDSRSG